MSTPYTVTPRTPTPSRLTRERSNRIRSLNARDAISNRPSRTIFYYIANLENNFGASDSYCAYYVQWSSHFIRICVLIFPLPTSTVLLTSDYPSHIPLPFPHSHQLFCFLFQLIYPPLTSHFSSPIPHLFPFLLLSPPFQHLLFRFKIYISMYRYTHNCVYSILDECICSGSLFSPSQWTAIAVSTNVPIYGF